MIRAIVTDFDGTLVDTFEANFCAYQEAFQKEKINLTKAEYEACFGLRFERFMEAMNIDDIQMSNRIREYKKQFYPKYFSRLTVNKPLLILIKTFRGMGGLCAIASTARTENLMNVLKFLGLTDEFDCILSGADVKNGKPDPEIYLKAMIRLGVSPDETMIFEDSAVGVEAAEQSGAYFMRIIL